MKPLDQPMVEKSVAHMVKTDLCQEHVVIWKFEKIVINSSEVFHFVLQATTLGSEPLT
jgi:hypothetical protein